MTAMSFFLAIPSSGSVGYVFGLTRDLDASLAPFRQRVPDACMRVLVVSPTNALHVLETAKGVIKRTPDVTYRDYSYGYDYEVPQGVTGAGPKMMVDVVSAVADGDVSETELPPSREAEAPRAAASDLYFFFAHVGHTCAKYSMGTSADPFHEARGLVEKHPREATTLYCGRTSRSGELITALSAVLLEETAVRDAKLVDDFIVPVLRAVIGPEPEGLSVRIL